METMANEASLALIEEAAERLGSLQRSGSWFAQGGDSLGAARFVAWANGYGFGWVTVEGLLGAENLVDYLGQ